MATHISDNNSHNNTFEEHFNIFMNPNNSYKLQRSAEFRDTSSLGSYLETKKPSKKITTNNSSRDDFVETRKDSAVSNHQPELMNFYDRYNISDSNSMNFN